MADTTKTKMGDGPIDYEQNYEQNYEHHYGHH